MSIVQRFQKDFPEFVNKMKEYTHHVSMDNLSTHHLEGDIWTHTMLVTKLAELGEERSVEIDLACLLHDIGKPNCIEYDEITDKITFYSHASYSTFKALEVLKKWDIDKDIRVVVLMLINLHRDSIDETLLKLYKGNLTLFFYQSIMAYNNNNGRFSLEKNTEMNNMASDKNIDFISSLSTEKIEKPLTLTMYIGTTCSGKSTYHKKTIPTNETKTQDIVISYDDVLTEIAGERSHFSHSEAMNREDLDSVIDELVEDKFLDACIQKKNIVLDMTNLSKKSRERFVSNNLYSNGYEKRAIVFATNIDEVKRRNNNREDRLMDNDLDEMFKSFDVPTYDEFDHIEWIFD